VLNGHTERAKPVTEGEMKRSRGGIRSFLSEEQIFSRQANSSVDVGLPCHATESGQFNPSLK
jgi:hypothetical protein